jgi:hypothetical protein
MATHLNKNYQGVTVLFNFDIKSISLFDPYSNQDLNNIIMKKLKLTLVATVRLLLSPSAVSTSLVFASTVESSFRSFSFSLEFFQSVKNKKCNLEKD